MIAPGEWLGLLGGGQLGRMFCHAAQSMGYRVAVLDPGKEGPAASVADMHICADYEDQSALLRLAQHCRAVTTEFENVPARSLEALSAHCRVTPGARAVQIVQDRIEEKAFITSQGVSVAPYVPVRSLEDLSKAPATLFPGILKVARLGYDGKGQVWIRDAADAASALETLGGRPSILEAAARFSRELSVIAARGTDGAVAVYPLGQNIHENGILRTTIAPADNVDADTQARAVDIATNILNGLDYVGVIGVELFALGDRLLVNEIAPRVHNTGHWTQDGCGCDQFEQHIRAIAGWPLGSTKAHAKVEMTNLLGDEINDWPTLAANPSNHLHFYGKHEARAGRKMAHVNKVLEDL